MQDIRKEIPDQIAEIGYDTYNIISNLGTVSAIVIFYVAKVAVYYIILVLRQMDGGRDFLLKYKTDLEKKLFF